MTDMDPEFCHDKRFTEARDRTLAPRLRRRLGKLREHSGTSIRLNAQTVRHSVTSNKLQITGGVIFIGAVGFLGRFLGQF